MADQDIYSNSDNLEGINSPNNQFAQNVTSDNSFQPYHNVKISNCSGDVNDSELESSRIINQNRNTAESEGIPRRDLMFHDLRDIKSVVSEVKACERELSDVESKLLDLTEEIRNREVKIIDLEDEISDLHETKCELEAENYKMRASFKECLQKSISWNNDKLSAKILNLENELEHLQFSHAEEINCLMNREDLRSRVYANVVEELESKLKDLRVVSREQLSHSMRQNRMLEAEKEYLEDLTREFRKRIDVLREKLQLKLMKIIEYEKELKNSHNQFSAIERRCRELEIERNLLREQRDISEERFKSMKSEIINMRSAIQASNSKISTLEAKLDEKERIQTAFESLLHRAEKGFRKTQVTAVHLENDKKALMESNFRMESTINELRSTCTNAKQEVSKANKMIRKMRRCIAKYSNDKYVTEITITECLQKAGIVPPKSDCRKSSEDLPTTSGLDVHKSLQLISTKIDYLLSENENLKKHLATQQSKILEKCSKNAAHVNANFNQLEAKLRIAREENKQLCIQQILLRHQLETQKLGIEKYADVKSEHQEQVDDFEPPIKCKSSGPMNPIRNPELCNQLARFFEERAKTTDSNSLTPNHSESIRSIACKINKLEKDLKG